MAQGSIKCRHCNEVFVPAPGKRGYFDECQECVSERYQTKTVDSSVAITSTKDYTFSLESQDGRRISMDGREVFGYNEVEPVGQMALVAMQTMGNVFSVALTSGSTKFDGDWEAGRRWKVPTPQSGRVPAITVDARKHRFSYVTETEQQSEDARPIRPTPMESRIAPAEKGPIAGDSFGFHETSWSARPDSASANAELDKRIAELLLANRAGGMDWGQFSHPQSKPWSKKLANRFLLCCLLDYQIPSDAAWANGYRLIDDVLHDPDDVWQTITSLSEDEWNSKHYTYRLHRFPVAHRRLWRIGAQMCGEFDGDARRIRDGRDAQSVLKTLWRIGAGDQISRMIVGALRDCKEIAAKASDVKGDVYVRRVLGRVLLGNETDAGTSVRLAGRLHPDDPWQLDSSLWQVGKTYCKAKDPNCRDCYLASNCRYACGVIRLR